MPPTGATEFCAVAGVERDPSQIHSHAFEGTTPAFLRRAVDLDVATSVADDVLSVGGRREQRGRRAPRPDRRHAAQHDPGGRRARPRRRRARAALAVRVVPNWGGVGDPRRRQLRRAAGQGLRARAGRRVPGRERAVHRGGDRLRQPHRRRARRTPAPTPSSSRPSGRSTTCAPTVRLYYRRAFKPLADQRKWNVPLGGNRARHARRRQRLRRELRGRATRRASSPVAAKLKGVRGEIGRRRSSCCMGRSSCRRATTLDAADAGLRVLLAAEGASESLVDERVSGFVAEDPETIVYTGDGTGAVRVGPPGDTAPQSDRHRHDRRPGRRHAPAARARPRRRRRLRPPYAPLQDEAGRVRLPLRPERPFDSERVDFG